MPASMSLSDLLFELSAAEPRCLARYSRHASSVTLLLKLSRKNASFVDPFLLLTILPLPVFLFFFFSLIYFTNTALCFLDVSRGLASSGDSSIRRIREIRKENVSISVSYQRERLKYRVAYSTRTSIIYGTR